MKDLNKPCIFCSIKKDELLFENNLAYASTDSYPVSKFHSLVVPKRCIKNFFELNNQEIIACNDLIKKLQKKILSEDNTVKGFNIGTNSGKAAGQSIFHCHIHVIPRREGDVENPQGGVRSVIPSKQHYIRKK
ncbi:HIT family protein [Candidatus Pelagibacter communis]|uniref:HIT family protein n=1 Tax=Pelagibacter ubique TaxID=198252 RepID=UPI00094C6EE4|nr:HIT family protein [Candidatus Pelagibacter ubique]